jgi:hypothetical protein
MREKEVNGASKDINIQLPRFNHFKQHLNQSDIEVNKIREIAQKNTI